MTSLRQSMSMLRHGEFRDEQTSLDAVSCRGAERRSDSACPEDGLGREPAAGCHQEGTRGRKPGWGHRGLQKDAGRGKGQSGSRGKGIAAAGPVLRKAGKHGGPEGLSTSGARVL